MSQQTFSDVEYSQRIRITKREQFLDEMDCIIPWARWIEIIRPYYYKQFRGKRGRRPLGIELMLRMYLLQAWFTLSDEGVEDAIYDSYAMRKFMGLNFLQQKAPDATTLLHFRHLMERHHLSQQLFEAINQELEASGLMMRGGSIIDATIISAPTSTKNETKSRDPEMHQTKKGNEWYFGMKLHVGVDVGTGNIKALAAGPANEHDLHRAAQLIQDDDEVLYGDAGYTGIEKRPEIQADEHKRGIDYRINRRPGSVYRHAKNDGQYWERVIERQKSAVRSKVEFAFRFIKIQCGFKKTVYRGIEKNLNRLYILAASANLYGCVRAGRELIPIQG